MTPDEQDKLEDIHQEIRETRTQIEVVDERTERIDEKTEKVDQRVFGPEGLETRVNKNSDQIARLNGIGAVAVTVVSGVLAKVLNVIP